MTTQTATALAPLSIDHAIDHYLAQTTGRFDRVVAEFEPELGRHVSVSGCGSQVHEVARCLLDDILDPGF